MTYLINFLLIPVYYITIKIVCRNRNKCNKYFVIVACIHAVLFRALANPYNYVDTEGYALAFSNISSFNLKELFSPISNPYWGWGIGYVLLNWMIGQFLEQPVFLFIIVTFLSLLPLFWLFYKLSDNVFLTVLLFLSYPMMYLMGFGVLRQHIAVTYVLLALYYVDRMKISFPLALLALSFHTSAIVFLPYYLWRRIPFRQMNLGKVFFYITFGCVLGRAMMHPILSSFSRYSDLLAINENSNNIVPVLILGGLVALAFCGGLNHKLYGIKNDFLNFCVFGLAIALFGIGLPGMGRLTIYFLYAATIAVTFLNIYSLKLKTINNAYLICLFLLIVIMLIKDINDKFGFNYSYSFFWEKYTTI